MYSEQCTPYTITIVLTKNDAQSLNLKTEYRNETQHRNPGFMNEVRARQLCGYQYIS